MHRVEVLGNQRENNMWFLIILSIILSISTVFLIWVVYRLTEQIEEFEDAVEWFENWKNEFVTSLAEANRKMKEIDRRGTFSSDDEIGFAYETINQCIEQLNQLGVITYGGEETDSTEEIQGQEEEE